MISTFIRWIYLDFCHHFSNSSAWKLLSCGFHGNFSSLLLILEVFLQALHFTCPLKFGVPKVLSSLCFYILPREGTGHISALQTLWAHPWAIATGTSPTKSSSASSHLPGYPGLSLTCPHDACGNLLRADTCSPENQRVTHTAKLDQNGWSSLQDKCLPVSSDLSWSFMGWSNQSLKRRPFPYYWDSM